MSEPFIGNIVCDSMEVISGSISQDRKQFNTNNHPITRIIIHDKKESLHQPSGLEKKLLFYKTYPIEPFQTYRMIMCLGATHGGGSTHQLSMARLEARCGTRIVGTVHSTKTHTDSIGEQETETKTIIFTPRAAENRINFCAFLKVHNATITLYQPVEAYIEQLKVNGDVVRL